MVGKTQLKDKGSVFLIVVFLVALLAAVVSGMLQLNTEEIQLMRNHICAAEALAVAEAGLNDAFAQIRADPNWSAGFTNKAFNDGSYTVTVTGAPPSLVVESTGTTSGGFVARIAGDITTSSTSPYIIRIDNLRINE